MGLESKENTSSQTNIGYTKRVLERRLSFENANIQLLCLFSEGSGIEIQTLRGLLVGGSGGLGKQVNNPDKPYSNHSYPHY